MCYAYVNIHYTYAKLYTLYNTLLYFIQSGASFTDRLTVYTSDQGTVRMNIKLYPLYTNTIVTHYLCIFEQAFDFPAITNNNNMNINNTQHIY